MEFTQRFRGHLAYIPIFQVTTVAASNQPGGGVAKVVSSSASDTQIITIFGARTNLSGYYYEQLALNGTTAVTSTTTDWNNILGAYLGNISGVPSAVGVGTITVANTGGSTIYSIAAGARSIGTVIFNLAGKNVEVENITGNTWFNAATPTNTNYTNSGNLTNNPNAPVATTANGIQMAGRMSRELKVIDFISFVSDSSSTCQILQLEG